MWLMDKHVPNELVKDFPHSFSDHCPLLIQTSQRINIAKRKRFYFEA